MGTHPIFESDFDCLTDPMKLFNYLAAILVPNAFARSAGRFQAGPIDTGLFYDEYLQAVIAILEKDEKLQLKMEELEIDDPSHSHLKLDEVKRNEVERIRKLLKAENKLQAGKKVNFESLINDVGGHVDTANPKSSFGMNDLKALIGRVAADMTDFDAKRHQKFKEYEMHKVIEEEKKTKEMTEEDKKAYEKKKLERQSEHLRKSKRLPHPFSQKFVVEVWNSFDHLQGSEFNPKTFFVLHDVSGDGFLDAYELEA